VPKVRDLLSTDVVSVVPELTLRLAVELFVRGTLAPYWDPDGGRITWCRGRGPAALFDHRSLPTVAMPIHAPVSP
jgi:hypothetical protein